MMLKCPRCGYKLGWISEYVKVKVEHKCECPCCGKKVKV
jgi:uncharacterized protein (UPF0212 family)